MKLNYPVLFLFLCTLTCANAQLTPVNVKIKDDLQKGNPYFSSNKRSAGSPKSCGSDTIEYSYRKASTLVTISVSRGRSLGQLYSCPKPITISGFDFYAFIIPNPPTNKKMNMICNIYKAGPDSLPVGLPLRSDTVQIDSSFGGGLLSKIIKRAQFAPITLDSNYILTVETDSATLTAGVVTNNYANGDGRRENLNSGSISGLWYNGKNLNVNGTPFDCDVLLHPYVTYNFGTDFSIKNNCYGLADSVRFSNFSGSNVAGSKMYNLYKFYNIDYICHLWDAGNGTGNAYAVDYKTKYYGKGNYQVRLISNVYTYKSTTFSCADTAYHTVYFKPDIPTVSGPTSACVGDTIHYAVASGDTGVVFEWLRKPNLPPFQTGFSYSRSSLTKDDTLYVRANNHGCLSGLRMVSLKVYTYPAYLIPKDDSVCAGSKANLKASSNIGSIKWYTSLTSVIPFYSGPVYQTNVLMKDTFFYVEAGNGGCILNPRQIINARVGANFAPASPVVSPDTTVCLSSGSTIILSATAGPGLSVRWYDVSSGGVPVNTGNNFSFLPSKREVKTYYADAFNGVCGSTREAINITVEDYPKISNIATSTICKGDSAHVSFNLPFGDATWFDASSGGSIITSGTAYADYPQVTTDYFIETSSGVCVSPTRTRITATVNTFPTVTRIWGDTICAKHEAHLKSVYTGNGTLNWYEDDTTSVILASGKTFVTPVLNGSRKYFAQPVYAGCIGPRIQVLPTVLPVPFSGFQFEVLTWQQVKVSPINSGNSTIKWDFGDGFKSTAKDVTHRYPVPGTYKITLTLTSPATGCVDSTVISVLVEQSGIEDVSRLPVANLYPNPASLVLNVSSAVLEGGSAHVRIFNSTGALVLECDAPVIDGAFSIPVGSLARGLYMMYAKGLAPSFFVKE